MLQSLPHVMWKFLWLFLVLFLLSPGFPNECFVEVSWAPDDLVPPLAHFKLFLTFSDWVCFWDWNPVTVYFEHCNLTPTAREGQVPISNLGSPIFYNVEWSEKIWVYVMILPLTGDVILIISFQVPHVCWPHRMVMTKCENTLKTS